MEIRIMKNMEPAPYMGSRFGQDVEAKGTYVLEKDHDHPLSKNWVEGRAEIKNPLIIPVNDENLIKYKYDLAAKYKAKGKRLTKKLMVLGYDAIVTKYDKGHTGEIVLFPNCSFMLNKVTETKSLVKNLLNESFTYTLIENFLEEDYPLSFNMEHFKTLKNFSQRIKYCEENLKRISSGSSRIVYMIDDTKVLKLAKNQKGIAQNEVEIQWGQDSYFGPILAHTFDYDPDDLWVEMELARKVTKKDFIRLTDCTIEDLYRYLFNFNEINNGKKPIFNMTPELKERLDENEFVSSIVEFMANNGSPAGDFGKLNSYGIVQRNGQDNIVLIDFGLTNDVYQTYYS